MRIFNITFKSIVFFLATSSISLADQKEILISAKSVQYFIKIYKINLGTIKKISDLESGDEKELIERDLILCELAGESNGNMRNLRSATMDLRDLLDDYERRSILERQSYDLLTINNQLRYGFCRGSSEDFRVIKKLQEHILNSDQNMKPIVEILDNIIKAEQ